MKRALAILSLIVAATAAAAPLWIHFTDSELQRAKREALRAINSPEVWARFPGRRHQSHYTPLPREISFGFSRARGLNTVTVIIPTTHTTGWHRDTVHVTFDQGLKLADIEEVPQI